MSAMDEVRSLVTARQAELDTQQQQAQATMNDAIDAAHQAYDEATAPIFEEQDQLAAVLASLPGSPGSEPSPPAADASPEPDPQVPSDPAPVADQPFSSLTPSPSTPSEPDSDPSPTSSPETSETTPPSDPGTAETADPTTAVPAALASMVEPQTPVKVSSPTTGEIKIVTAQDVLDSQDTAIKTEDLSEDARVLRNSDYL